jgi:hypothetical protein
MKIEDGKEYRTRGGWKALCWQDDNGVFAAIHFDKRESVEHRADGSCHIRGDDYDIVAEWSDDTDGESPKLWRDMTDAEKGALLLAHYEGKVIDVWHADTGSFGRPLNPALPFRAWHAYRVRPEPKRETVTLWWEGGCIGSREYYDDATHRITFDRIDGEPDCDSVKMERL